jgi:hypothetical protein
MRTKTLILTAALSIAAAATSMAQAVYSVNIVGYINLNIPAGLSMIANQLDDSGSPRNQVQNILGNPSGNVTVNFFNPATGNYDQSTYDPFGGPTGGPIWFDGNRILEPGGGAFVDSVDAFTATLVGEVRLVSSLSIPPGLSIRSSVIPQSAPVTAMGFPFDLPAAPDPVTIYRYNRTTGGYDSSSYDPFGGPTGGAIWFPSPPSPNIGESWFVDNAGASALIWPRTFTP